MAWPLIVGAAMLPWILRGAPGVARGAAGLGSAAGRKKAGQALFGKGGFNMAGTRVRPGAARRAGTWAGNRPMWQQSAAAGGLGWGLDSMLSGQPPPEDDGSQGTRPPTMDRSMNSPWNPSDGLMDARDAKRMRSETFWGNMNKMMQMSAILNATGGDTSGFQKMMGMANKKILSDMDDQRLMDQYDSVFQQGNMPNTAIEAYERMIASKAGPEAAAKVAGQYVKMRSLKANDNTDRTALIDRVNTYLQANNVRAAVAAVKQAIGMKIIPIDAYKNELGNMLSGEELDDRIKEMLSAASSGAGIQEAG